MIEVALVFDQFGKALFWPSPEGNSEASIDDSSNLWDRIWRNKDTIGGVAHTHPWSGEASPSITDLTTYVAIEKGLGKQLVWPIITMDEVRFFVFDSHLGRFREEHNVHFMGTTHWMENVIELRRSSSV